MRSWRQSVFDKQKARRLISRKRDRLIKKLKIDHEKARHLTNGDAVETADEGSGAEAITGKDLAKIEMVRRLIETRAKLLDYDKVDLQRVAEEAERDGKSVAARITMIEVVKSYNDDSNDYEDSDDA